jgi:hypothetical protein
MFIGIVTLSYAQYSIFQGFEGSVFPPADWALHSVDRVSSAVTTPYAGMYCVRMDNNSDYMISPLLPNPEGVNYWVKMRDGGLPFVVEYAFDISGPWTMFPGYPDNATSSWAMKTIDLTDIENAYVRWRPYSTVQCTGTLFFDDYTFCMDEPTVPIELSSFVAAMAVQSDNQIFVELQWTTQSETEVMGYNLYRNESNSISSAIRVNPYMIGAHNTSVESNYTFMDEEVSQGTLYYWLENKGFNGVSEYFGPISIIVSDGQNSGLAPVPFTISNLGPNPFNPELATITGSYGLSKSENVQVLVYNIKGQKVRTLINGRREAGYHNEISWNGRDDNGKVCKSGMYYLMMITDNYNVTKKLSIIK